MVDEPENVMVSLTTLPEPLVPVNVTCMVSEPEVDVSNTRLPIAELVDVAVSIVTGEAVSVMGVPATADADAAILVADAAASFLVNTVEFAIYDRLREGLSPRDFAGSPSILMLGYFL